MGRIKHSNETGLRAVNQRKMAKAIRRAVGLGIHPSVHRYPEILKWVNAPFGVKSYAPKGSTKSVA
jgi:small subunit ribosomal protein S18